MMRWDNENGVLQSVFQDEQLACYVQKKKYKSITHRKRTGDANKKKENNARIYSFTKVEIAWPYRWASVALLILTFW
jgi:hypothetical protein